MSHQETLLFSFGMLDAKTDYFRLLINCAVNCSMKALDKVPGSIPLTTRELILSYNKLVTLPVLEMSYLNELVYLDCSHNLLEMGLDFTFPGIVKLTYLDLSFNKLSFVTPYTFSQLNKLLLLNLSSNPKLVEVKDKAFDSNPLLRFVDMSDCALTYVGGELFKDLHNLHSLRLKGNPWNCDCSFLEFCNWIKKADVVYPGETFSQVRIPWGTKLHYLCLVHLDFQDFVFLGLMAICIFFGGTLVAWLVGLATVIYYHPVMKETRQGQAQGLRQDLAYSNVVPATWGRVRQPFIFVGVMTSPDPPATHLPVLPKGEHSSCEYSSLSFSQTLVSAVGRRRWVTRPRGRLSLP
uniref:Leucine rich repeat containing 52 n=1 Tax=Podarcis muralis TaxID=64176 RepID=A0A670IBK1_PODMU